MLAYLLPITMLLFLVITALAYIFCPKNKRYILILASSLVFYMVYSKIGVVFLLTTIITTYVFAVLIDGVAKKYDLTGLEKAEKKVIKAKIKSKKKGIISIYIIINIGILIALKYFNFFAHSTTALLNSFGCKVCPPMLRLILPLGISYYTLQAMGYVIDVYRGKYVADKNILHVGLFIAFFPQLYEGPFGRYDLLMPQLTQCENIKSENVNKGLYRIIWGFFKVFMIANRAAILSDALFMNFKEYGGLGVFIGIIAFTIQLYAEFSGYIDLASGIAKVFGVELTKNFDLPFISQNVGEFWRRWHISLGTWFRDYVFYSVSTSKVFSKIGKKFNNFALQNTITITCSMFCVWFLTGLWHGANTKYIVYGLYYFVLMLIFNFFNPRVNKLLEKHNISQDNKVVKYIRIVKTLVLVGIGMLIFRARDLHMCMEMLSMLFKSGHSKFILSNLIDIRDFVVLVVSFIILIAVSIIEMKNKDIESMIVSLSPVKKYWFFFASICIILVFGAYGLGYLPPDPIYGGF